ncbi:hypothetical protein MANES_16G088150v8 [Manihot esculenta]|uniref:Uncharacterized protein n=1 Tax=Manihot esculenta TaxID=3983 RepID=A0ACB7G8D2_MANES|nr:hypothetical protein MANES_16G088150v8 [Manihot esculenta]
MNFFFGREGTRKLASTTKKKREKTTSLANEDIVHLDSYSCADSILSSRNKHEAAKLCKCSKNFGRKKKKKDKSFTNSSKKKNAELYEFCPKEASTTHYN